MASSVSRGNYYKKKSKEHYEKLGYTVQITEFMCGRQIAPGKIIYQKRDVFGSDGIAMNGKEIIFWNSKSTDVGQISWLECTGRKEFEKYPFPDCVKRQLIIWEPKKKPKIIEVI